MPSNVSREFETFLTSVGVRHEIVSALWQADIKSPQDLAALQLDDLKKISSNPLLVNHIYPVLQKNVFKISMAKDPCRRALDIIRQAAGNDEPMDTVESDATKFEGEGTTNDRRGNNGRSGVRAEQAGGMRVNNNGNELNAGGSSVIQSHFTTTTKRGDEPLGKPSISITGGNFIQSSVMSQGPVTYNNTNSVINASANMDSSVESLRRRQKQLQETVFFNGNRMRVADMQWSTGETDFWLDRISMPRSDIETYSMHLNSDDVYHIHSHGRNRALILNNKTFRHGTNLRERTGAHVDTENMEKALKELGFKVQVEQDKSAEEMRALLQNFARSTENVYIDMVAVYIGSHGERDEQGNDTFLGSDGERVKFNDVKEMFGPRDSPHLKKKPKLFFLQFCRVDTDAPPVRPAGITHPTQETQADSGGFTPGPQPVPEEPAWPSEDEHPMDVVCVYATQPGSKAYRDTEEGSWFVTALIKVFLERCRNDDLLSMLTKVNNSVSFKEGMEQDSRAVQISEVVHNLRKKIFFYPGLGV